jgi:hypothetical protein
MRSRVASNSVMNESSSAAADWLSGACNTSPGPPQVQTNAHEARRSSARHRLRGRQR